MNVNNFVSIILLIALFLLLTDLAIDIARKIIEILAAAFMALWNKF